MERVQGTGKTVEEAVENALSQLGVTADEAEITVESTGNKGLFGLGAKPRAGDRRQKAKQQQE